MTERSLSEFFLVVKPSETGSLIVKIYFFDQLFLLVMGIHDLALSTSIGRILEGKSD